MQDFFSEGHFLTNNKMHTRRNKKRKTFDLKGLSTEIWNKEKIRHGIVYIEKQNLNFVFWFKAFSKEN